MNKPEQKINFRRLFISQGISGLGDWMATFAFMSLALEISGSTAAVGGILTLRLIPAALGGSLAARLAQKWSKKNIMLNTDLLRAGIVAVVPLVDQVWWIYIWAFCLEGASIIFVSARDASIGDLTPKDRLPAANGMILGSSYGSIPVGAGLFALFSLLPEWNFLGINSHWPIFWADALSFLASAWLIFRIKGIAPRPSAKHSPKAAADIKDAAVGNTSEDAAENAAAGNTAAGNTAKVKIADALKIPLIRTVIPVTISVAVGLGALFSLGISLIREELSASDVEFGVLIALFGAGAITGLGVVQKLKLPHLAMTRLGTLVMGILVALMSLSPWLWGTFLGAAGFGLGAAMALTAGMSSLQSLLREEQQVMAFAVFHMVIRIGLGASAIIAGLLGDLFSEVPIGWGHSLSSTRLVLTAAGVLVLLSALSMKDITKSFDSETSAPSPPRKDSQNK